MTGLDGLVDARRQQISEAVRRSSMRLVPGSGQTTRSQSFWEGTLATLAVPEDILTKAIGSVVTNDPKYSFSQGLRNYHTTTGFADLFRSAGVPHTTAAVLGLAAAIANPLDPLNKVRVLQETRLGLAAREVEQAGKNLVKGEDGLLRIATDGIVEEITKANKALESGQYAPDVAKAVKQSVRRLENTQKHADSINDLLVELQQRGMDVGKMRLAGSVFDQIREGQRALIGFTSPLSFSHVPFSGHNPVSEASVFGLSGPKTAALVKGIAKTTKGIVKPLTDAAYKIADNIGIPTVRTAAAKKAASLVKTAFDNSHGRVEELERNLLSVYKRFLSEAGEAGGEAAKNDLLGVLQSMEFTNAAHKQMAIEALAKTPLQEAIPAGKDVVVGVGQGLSDEQKLQLSPSGVSDAELPVAIGHFQTANSPSIRVGTHQQHEVKILGKYIVAKVGDAKTALSDLNDLEGIFGNRVWAKHTAEDGTTYLVQKRQPGAVRISDSSLVTAENFKNLESIGAQLSTKKKGFTALKPEDILVAPNGAVQIINPSVITEYKTAKDAVANSKAALNSLADDLSLPRGSFREFNQLRNVKTARAVPRGADGMTFRVARPLEVGADVVYVPAHDLLEQAVNTDGHRAIVRGAYEDLTTGERAASEDIQTSNNVAFHREQIRKAVAQGVEPHIDPISLVVDDHGSLYVANGRDRLTAAIMEGYEAVPVYRRSFIGDIKDIEGGLYTGRSIRLGGLWSAADATGKNFQLATRGLVSNKYSLVDRSGEVVKLEAGDVAVSEKLPGLFNQLVSMGPQFVGKARTQRIESALALLKANFGNTRNAFLYLANAAEKAPDVKMFVGSLEKALINPQTGKGIALDNVLRHVDAEALFSKFRNASTETLDALASRGVLTVNTIGDVRRALLATSHNDRVLIHLDEASNTLRVVSAEATSTHLQTVAENFINKSATMADVDPYARIELIGTDGPKKLEVRDLFQDTPHPRLADMMEPIKAFQISKEQKAILQKHGIFIEEGKNVEQVRNELAKRGINFGVLLKEQEVVPKSTQTGQFVNTTRREVKVVRPEFSFFVTRSGALAIGTKHQNVSDLLNTVFEEGPAFFEEFGVMTTGKVIVSNPFGSKLSKIGVGEMSALTERLKLLAQRFNDLGLGKGTVMEVHVPFDEAAWRAMYGERVTIGDLLSEDFKLKIPSELRGHVPDIRVLAPSKLATGETGVVAFEKTRLANKRLQGLFDFLQETGDKLFLEQAKAGVPISYYESWFGRNLTQQAKETLNAAWLNYPNKESKSFKYIETALKGRVFTDLTTQEINTIIKRLQKEGVEGAENVISDVVKEFRNGYELKPSKETAASLAALSTVLPEGVDFFYTDPIWSLSLSGRQAARAISRAEVVDGLRDMGVAVWHGSVEELNKLRVGNSKEYAQLEANLAEAQNRLTQAQSNLDKIVNLAPDVQNNKLRAQYSQDIDTFTNQIAEIQGKKAKFIDRAMNGKVMDTMVDPMSEQVWVRGTDVQRLVDNGIIKQQDILGDVSDAFVRLPIKKYESLLSEGSAEVFLFPKEVAGAVQRYFGATTKDGFGRFLQLWDSIHSLWRNWTLFPIPSYHVRNGVSNMFMAYLGGVTDPQVYREAMNIFNVIDNHRKGVLSIKQAEEALGAISFGSASGQVYTGKQLYNAFVRHGGLAGGLHFNEFNAFGDLTRASEFERESIRAGLRPSSELAGSLLYDNAVLRAGVSAASYVENRFRFAAFLDSIMKGHVETQGGRVISGVEAAAMRMKSIFYDYSDLSAFERSWLRRVIPFYSWSRHNIPRMLETLVTEPVKHYRMQEFLHQIEVGANDGQPVNEQEIPDWMRDKYGIVVSKTKQGNYIVKTTDGFLPMSDAFKVLGGSGILSMLKDGLTPFVKIPIEQLLNYSFYSGKEIETVPGQRSSSYTLGELGFSRRATTQGPLGVLNLLLNDSLFRGLFRPGGEIATKVLDPIFNSKEEASIKLALYGLFIGRSYEVNPQQARIALFRDWANQQSRILGVRAQAMRSGDVKSVEDADRMLTWLRLQYPGDSQ